MFIRFSRSSRGVWGGYRFPYNIALSGQGYEWLPVDKSSLGAMRFQGDALNTDSFAVRDKLTRLGQHIRSSSVLKRIEKINVGGYGIHDELHVLWREPQWELLHIEISHSFMLPVNTDT